MSASSGIITRALSRLLPERALTWREGRKLGWACMAYGGPHPGVAARPAGSGFVSRFAWCPDYHRPVGDAVARFAAGIEARTGTLTRAYVDTGPVLEKAYAAAAGLGFIGRHGLLVHPRFGSFVFLGVVLTDA